MNIWSNDQISVLGVFRDKDLELSFQTKTFKDLNKAISLCSFLLFTTYLLFSLPELVKLQIPCFIRDLSIRILTVLFYLILYYFLGRFKNYRSYILIITTFEFCFIFFYILLLAQYSNMSFTVICMATIVIITLFTILPNNWLNSFFASLLFLLSFALFCMFNTYRFSVDKNYISGSIYIAIVFALNTFNSYRYNFSKRSQFYDNVMLHNLLNTDTLTGAFTRVKFDEEIKKHISISQQTGRRLSIAIFDIDNFKRINDTYGHLEGDNILSGIANIVNENMRPRDILTRWGGEEFVIVFPCTGLASAIRISERLRLNISNTEFSIGECVTCSFGVTEYKKGDTPISLLRRADKLLYEAKSSGKNAVRAIWYTY